MTTVADILKYIETLAPTYMKMDWDNVGLLCGSRETPVTKVLVALDPFEGVCREAAAWGAELIVTHHPIIFDPLKSVTEETTVGRSIMTLCRHGISAVNAHTNLDCAPGGVNDVLAATLGLNDVETIPPFFRDDQGRQWGLLRRGRVEEQPLDHQGEEPRLHPRPVALGVEEHPSRCLVEQHLSDEIAQDFKGKDADDEILVNDERLRHIAVDIEEEHQTHEQAALQGER